MFKGLQLSLLAALLSFFARPSYAQWMHQGQVSFESRHFKDDHQNQTQDDAYSVFSRVDSQYNDSKYRLSLRAMARVDQKNPSRNIIAPEDVGGGITLNQESSWQLMAGYKLFYWTVLEAFHPADVINSRNFDSDIENLEKMGELFLGSERSVGDGQIGLYFFPRYQRPRLPGSENRLGLGTNLARPRWVDGQGQDGVGDEWGWQGALKWSHTLGPSDWLMFVAYHMDRSTPIIGTKNFAKSNVSAVTPYGAYPLDFDFAPYYFQVLESGFNYQMALGDFVLKAEGDYKFFQQKRQLYTITGLRSPDNFGTLALGGEYLWTHSWGGQSSLFLEGQYASSKSRERVKEMVPFQADLMMGVRYAFNDEMGSEITASALVDVEGEDQQLYSLLIARRLSDQWKVKAGGRYYWAPAKNANLSGLEYLHKDHHLFLSLSRFF